MKTPEHVRQAAIADYLDGMTHKAVAHKYGIGHATVHRIIVASGVNRPRRIAPEVIAAAIDDYLQTGESTKKVAQRHSLSPDKLRVELKVRGLNRPSASKCNKERKAQAVADYASGATSDEVARKYGVSASTVITWARAAGVEIKKPGRPDQEPEPLGYEGRWMLIGGIRRPTHPAPRRVSVMSMTTGEMWENRPTTKTAPGARCANSEQWSQGLTDADRSAS